MKRAGSVALVVLGLAIPVAAQNVQPYSTSLVECSVIYSELEVVGARRGRSAEDVEKIRRVSQEFEAAAHRQAEAEGVADTGAHIAALTAEMETKWTGRFASLLKFRENKDWLDYCDAFGRAQGLPGLRN